MSYLLQQTSWKIVGLIIGIILFGVSFATSILFGQTAIPFDTAIEAFTDFDESSTEHIVITTTRVSRAVIATVIGASLAMAGALMQALTKNPLASPSIFGVNAGALFFVVFATVFLSINTLVHLMWIAFLGAAVAAVLVFFLGSLGRNGLSPVKIVLAGAAMTAFFTSFTQGLLVLNEQDLQGVLFWLAGSVSGRTLDMITPILPFMLAAGIGALLLGPHINLLATGEDVAKGLGQRTILIKMIMSVIIVILAGGSVAVGGSIGFVGLIIPHIARSIVGIDHRWLIPYSAFMGASLLLLADVGARFVIMPEEMPIGVMTALIGTPFFIYIARRRFAKDEK